MNKNNIDEFKEKSKLFIKAMSRYMNPLNINGIDIYCSKEAFSQINLNYVEIDVPLLTIRNPKNIPYSYYALKELILEELIKLDEMVGTNFRNSVITRNFINLGVNKKKIYFPSSLRDDFIKCVNGRESKINIRKFNTITTFELKFIMKPELDIFFNDSDRLEIEVGFKINKIFREHLSSGEFYFIEEEKYSEIIEELSDDPSELFEEKISDCFNVFTQYETFLDTSWQYYFIDFINYAE